MDINVKHEDTIHLLCADTLCQYDYVSGSAKLTSMQWNSVEHWRIKMNPNYITFEIHMPDIPTYEELMEYIRANLPELLL